MSQSHTNEYFESYLQRKLLEDTSRDTMDGPQQQHTNLNNNNDNNNSNNNNNHDHDDDSSGFQVIPKRRSSRIQHSLTMTSQPSNKKSVCNRELEDTSATNTLESSHYFSMVQQSEMAYHHSPPHQHSLSSSSNKSSSFSHFLVTDIAVHNCTHSIAHASDTAHHTSLQSTVDDTKTYPLRTTEVVELSAKSTAIDESRGTDADAAAVSTVAAGTKKKRRRESTSTTASTRIVRKKSTDSMEDTSGECMHS